MGDGGVLVLQDVGTMKSLHWRCEMCFDCVKRKRSAKLPWSATAPCTFAAAPSFQVCLRAFHMYILYVCVNIFVCAYVCGHVYMYIYACVYVFVHLCVYAHAHVYVYAYLCIECGSWYQCFSLWTVSCMRMCFRVHMYAYTYVCGYIYISAFFCSECYMHFTGVLGTSAWADMYVTQVCFYTNVHICEHTRCRLCTYVYMYVCVCMHAYAYGCVCASMILFDTLRRCC